MQCLLLVSSMRRLQDETISILIQFDHTFETRYVEHMSGGWRYVSGEPHYEADKYGIYFLNIADEQVKEFIASMKIHDCVGIIGVADGQYNMPDKPLYLSQEFNEAYCGGRGRVLSHVTTRPFGFKPRSF